MRSTKPTEGLRDVGGDGIHVCLGLLDGDARLEAAHGQEPVEVVIQLLGLEDEGDDQALIEAIWLAGGHDADDGVGRSINLDRLAEDLRIGAKSLPHFVDEDNDVFLAGHAFLGKKIAAIQKLDTHGAVEAGRGELTLDILRLIFGGEIEAAACPCIQVLKGLALVFPVDEVLGGDAIVKALNFGPDHDELIGLGIGHGSEQGGVHRGEDGGVGANAESQSEHRGEREDRGPAQLAQRVTEVHQK